MPHQLHEAVRRYDVGTIYHLAALLSASAEAAPQLAWTVNMSGLYNVLEVARAYGCQVFFPSSIGAFGPETQRDLTPQIAVQRPTTIYGVTKVAGELLCDYYASRFRHRHARPAPARPHLVRRRAGRRHDRLCG